MPDIWGAFPNWSDALVVLQLQPTIHIKREHEIVPETGRGFPWQVQGAFYGTQKIEVGASTLHMRLPESVGGALDKAK